MYVVRMKISMYINYKIKLLTLYRSHGQVLITQSHAPATLNSKKMVGEVEACAAQALQ